jgi:dTDP-4-amino-4,6-dideoxygalactose transaminase
MPKILEAVIRDDSLILGQNVVDFEASLGHYLGEGINVLSCANGTDALYLALSALKLEKGEWVATVANAGFYSTSAILRAGLQPYFIDVELSTSLTRLQDVEEAIRFGVKALVLTHLFGRVAPDTAQIVDACQNSGIFIVEDCAQAAGATFLERKAGTFGDIAAFSFYPTKNLGCLGDGGAVAFSGNTLGEQVRALRQYGWGEKYVVDTVGGINSRLDSIQASFLLAFLPFLDQENQLRRQVAAKYLEGIQNPKISLPLSERGNQTTWHLFVIRVTGGARSDFRAHMALNGIETDVHYPLLDTLMPAHPEFAGQRLSNSEQLVHEIVSIPMHPHLSSGEIEKILRVVYDWK